MSVERMCIEPSCHDKEMCDVSVQGGNVTKAAHCYTSLGCLKLNYAGNIIYFPIHSTCRPGQQDKLHILCAAVV